MPKISAPTVAEHRSAQRATLLRTAEEILLDEGIDKVTPGHVATAAGLARSTFYEYFPSRDDLLVALARVAFDAWGTEVAAAVESADPGRSRLHAYVTTTLRLTADGRHGLATALRDVPLSPKGRDDIVALHTALHGPLARVLREIDVTDGHTAAVLIHGLLGSAMQLVTAGKAYVDAAADVNSILDHGL